MGYGINSDQLQIVDVNGDGYPDIARSTSENELKVRYSTIGRTNMLKTVHRPLGATISMDYSIYNPIDGSKNGNTYKMPFSKWAMTSVVVNDGHTGDGEDIISNNFEYLEGVQDRRERSFLGFGIVKTHTMDATNTVYRTTVNEYATANIPDSELYVGCLDNRIRQYYYKKGVLTKTYMEDGLGRRHSEINYAYKYYTPSIPVLNSSVSDYNTSTTTTIADATATFNALSYTDNSRVLPLLVGTHTQIWEFDSESAGASSHMKEQFSSIDLYDKYGNVKQFQDKGANLNDIADDVKVNMLYYYNSNNVVNVPLEHRITNQGVVFRLSRNFIDPLGRVNQIRKYLGTSLTTDYALYDIGYDQYGNITSMVQPKGVLSDPNSSRMSYSYTYDAITQTYPVSIVDAYNYTSSTAYDYALGVPTQTTDINNNIVTYSYDSFGRPTEIKGPYQISWTIRNQYYPTSIVPVATTAHYDSVGEIYTSTFVDGLERVIQTKKELQSCRCTSESQNGYRFSISGKLFYDEFGRTVRSNLNTEEENCSGILIDALKTFTNNLNNVLAYTAISYDYLDRPLISTVYDTSAGDATTQMSYTFGADRYGVTQFMKQITLPNGNIAQSFTDSKARVVSSNQIGTSDTYWTSYQYNKINELLNVRDANDAVTSYTYDNFGRKLTENHPDSGISTFKYDLASRLKESTNANLLANGQKVLYKYTINQLTDIIYPSHTVNYSYGGVGSPDNGAGRMIYQSDLTGEQYFKYGKLGEVTENKRIVIDPLGNPRTFITSFEIDTWGRIKTLTYPDGEVVKYTYDNGGLITHIENTDGQVYLNSICYNKFEQRSVMIYGNNTTTYYGYDPQQLLINMSVLSSSNTTFMANRYNYDINFNITNIQNSSSSAAVNQLGGTENKSFEYDDFNRLSHSEGEWHGALEDQRFTLDMQYNSLHNIVSKVQSHQTSVLNANVYTDTNNSMDNDYSYTGGNHPHAPSTIDVYDPLLGTQSEQINNTYDANGNLTLISHDNLDTGISTTRGLYWDEQNRLQAIVDATTAYHYVYDASGERVLKSSGSSSNLVINGDQVTALNNPGAYTMYPSGYLVVGNHDYTKHYYSGSQRIASRIGDLSTVHNFESDSLAKQSPTKGKISLAAKKIALQKQLSTIYKKANLGKPNFALAPQAPVDPAEQQCENEYNALLQYLTSMMQPPPADNTYYSDCIRFMIQTHVQHQSYCQTMNIIKEQRKCYFDLGINKKPIWWYHPDHLGSSSYLTDFSGIPSHYYDYLPFGEEMVSQNTSVYNNFYKFSGKELDEDTGLYYFGARYYDPKWSVWLSVDAMAEKFPDQSPYVFTDNNPINKIDPDGRAAVPPDDHFDSSGKFLYTDFRKTNNIVIHTGVVNFRQMNDEVQLKDFTFNKSNYSTLSKIAGHYSKDAGVNLNNVHNGKISVSDAIITGHKGGQPEGYIESYNDGVYSATDVYGSSAIMNTHKSTVTINLNDGNVDPLLNDVNSFTATLDHEGGPIGHLVNPDKKHTDIYKDEMKKYSDKATPEFKQHLSENLEYYKKRGE